MKQSNVTVEARRRDGVCCGVYTLCFGSAFVVCLGDMLSSVWSPHCGVAGCTVVSGLAFWVFDWVFRSLVSLVLGGSY